MSELVDALQEQERAWNERPLVRSLYRGWYELVAQRLSSVPGDTVELGSGIGKLAESVPNVVLTDVEATPWTDRVIDAEALPFADASLANLVLVDVFHHLARPAAFFDEVVRTVAARGRLVLLEPYCSPLSRIAYARLHHEGLDLRADPFADDESVAAQPLDANIARPTLAFFRATDELARRWPELQLVERRRLSVLAYPLSGGFTMRPLVPAALRPVVLAIDRVLERPLAPLAAFRSLIVLERR